MKIAVVEFAGKGGMIHYAWQLCRGLRRNGADVTLITSREHYELERLEAPFDVLRTIGGWDPKPPGAGRTPVAGARRAIRRVWRGIRYYAEWLRVTALLARMKPDVVQLGDIRFPFDLFPILLLRARVRLLADVCHNVHPFSAGGRSGGMFDRSRLRRFFYRRIYRLFDVVFVHFERNRRELEETFPARGRRTAAIVHGNEAIFEELRAGQVDGASLRRRIGIGDGEPAVVFFGTLSRYKGTDVLLRAFPRIHRETGARLVLAGLPFHDFDVAAHRALAADLGVGDAVTWLAEYVDSSEVAAWMELADVMVFPYRDIYQSGAVHVAQTFGVPIVASDVGAFRDVIRDGQSGLLVPPEDAGALAEAVVRLLRDRDLASRLGSAAAADAFSRFSWDDVAATILRTYQEALPRR